MNKIYIGKIVGTHGIKGELKILSDFDYIDKVFIVNNKLIIDDKEYNIRSYRKHKNYHLVTLNNYTNINEVLFLLKKNVYFNKDEIKDIALDSDLLNYKVKSNIGDGKVIDIFKASPTNKIIKIKIDKEYMIPMNSIYIKINNELKEINVEIIEGM